MQQTSLNLVNAFLRIRKRIWANRNEEWIITLCNISVRHSNQFLPVPSFSWRHVIELRAQNYQFHHFCPVKIYKWFNLINHTYQGYDSRFSNYLRKIIEPRLTKNTKVTLRFLDRVLWHRGQRAGKIRWKRGGGREEGSLVLTPYPILLSVSPWHLFSLFTRTEGSLILNFISQLIISI